MDELHHLAQLLNERNEIDAQIAAIIRRPAWAGHIGEYVASRIFDITLHPSASNKGSDGHFNTGPLAGRSVNVKWYGKMERLLDVNLDAIPDYYLVFAGPSAPAMSSRDGDRPWVISSVYLFGAPALLQSLRSGKAKVGIATSVKKAMWDEAEIYPQQHNSHLLLTDAQHAQLALFAPQGPGEPSLYDEIAGLFVGDSFAAEVDAYIQAERQRERDEAAKEAAG